MDYSIMYAELDSNSIKYGQYCRFCGKEAKRINDEYYDDGLYCGCEDALTHEELTGDIHRTERELKEYKNELGDLLIKNKMTWSSRIFYIPDSMIVEQYGGLKICLGCSKTIHNGERTCGCMYAEAYNDDSLSRLEKDTIILSLQERYKENYKLVMNTIYGTIGGVSND